MCRQRSIPAAVPAEDMILPSTTYSPSGSRPTSRWRARKRSTYIQCAEARVLGSLAERECCGGSRWANLARRPTGRRCGGRAHGGYGTLRRGRRHNPTEQVEVRSEPRRARPVASALDCGRLAPLVEAQDDL